MQKIDIKYQPLFSPNNQKRYQSPIWLLKIKRHSNTEIFILDTINSKTCVKWSFQKDQKMVFKTNYRLMQVKSIAECSLWSILQYFRPSLSYHLSLRPLFCLFLSGHFIQVLLYSKFHLIHMIPICAPNKGTPILLINRIKSYRK